VLDNVTCAGDAHAERRVVCAVRAVQDAGPLVTPAAATSLAGVVVSFPEDGPFLVRDDFGVPVLTIGERGADLTVLSPHNEAEAWESAELIGQLNELIAGDRREPIVLPSRVASELERRQLRGAVSDDFRRHANFAELGNDARIFYLDSFGGHPAYALVIQAEDEIQVALFPLVATRTPNPELAPSATASPNR
jgi:hypothetical protein